MYTINIDTGGTFTDGYFTGPDRTVGVKVGTTPHDLTHCFWIASRAAPARST